VAAVIFAVLYPRARDGARFQQAMEATLAGDYLRARDIWRQLAESGHAQAQFNLGMLYANGYGAPADPGRAAAWYTKAADSGLPSAQVNLGLLYAAGRGVPRDMTRAADLFQQAHAAGNTHAAINLGVLHLRGLGVTQDKQRAVTLFRSAAERGSRLAQYHLARRYHLGDGVGTDLVEAYGWYAQASRIEDDTGRLAASSRIQLLNAITEDDLIAANRRAEALKKQLPMADVDASLNSFIGATASN